MDKNKAFISLYLIEKNETLETIKKVLELVSQPAFKNGSVVLSYSEFQEWIKNIDIYPILFHHYVKEVKSIKVPSATVYAFFKEAVQTNPDLLSKLQEYYTEKEAPKKKKMLQNKQSLKNEIDNFLDTMILTGKKEVTARSYAYQVQKIILDNKISDIDELYKYDKKTPIKQFLEYLDESMFDLTQKCDILRIE